MLLFFMFVSFLLYLIGIAPITLLFNISYTNMNDMNDMNDIIIISLILNLIIIGIFLFLWLVKEEIVDKIKTHLKLNTKRNKNNQCNFIIHAYKSLKEKTCVKIEFK